MLKLLTSSFITYNLLKKTKTANSEETTIESENQISKSAICILFPHGDSKVTGLVSFHQKNYLSETNIVANVSNLNPNSLHGFHIHKYGDLTNGCITAGPHFNPLNKTHGGPDDEERHVGDLGNIKTDEKGFGYLATTDKLVTLFGINSIIGRSCVVHGGTDDLGRGGNDESKKTGNAGCRLACGVIGLSDKFKNLPPQ